MLSSFAIDEDGARKTRAVPETMLHIGQLEAPCAQRPPLQHLTHPSQFSRTLGTIMLHNRRLRAEMKLAAMTLTRAVPPTREILLPDHTSQRTQRKAGRTTTRSFMPNDSSDTVTVAARIAQVWNACRKKRSSKSQTRHGVQIELRLPCQGDPLLGSHSAHTGPPSFFPPKRV